MVVCNHIYVQHEVIDATKVAQQDGGGRGGWARRRVRDCSSRKLVPPIPGHALHEKGLQRQIGVGTLVSSQERRALAVPLINRG